MITTVTNQDFIVCEQLRGRYVPHIFASRDQFTAWMRATRPRNIIARTCARGRAEAAIDHRSDGMPDTDDAAEALDFWGKMRARYPDHIARIERAHAIYQAHLADPAAQIIRLDLIPNGRVPLEATARIKSSTGTGYYIVDARRCTCPDFEKNNLCKHSIAARALCESFNIKLGYHPQN